MSNIRLQGNVSGSGTLTIASPNTNSDFTLNLPASGGTIPVLSSVTNNGVVFINSSGQATSGSALTFDGTNLGFGSAGQRITGDFSNATIANRVMFQTSTANGPTSVSAIPSGTNTQSDFFAFNAADPNNASLLLMRAGAAETTLRSAITGTGTFLPMTFHTSGSERMRLDTTGRLSIGTSASNTNAILTANGNIAVALPTRNAASSNQIGVWTSDDPVDNARAAIAFLTTAGASSSNSAIVFNTNQYGVSGGERMRIDSAGNVGIGTSSPSAKFDTTGTGTTEIRVRSQSSGNPRLGFWAEGNSYGYIDLERASGAFTFNPNSTERVRIDGSGNVGIGNPAANVNDQVAGVRPLLVSRSSTSTTIAGGTASIVIGNADTTTNNTSQLTFAALTGANTTYFASAAINCVFGPRTNGQYPTGQLVFSTSTALNLAPTEKMRINAGGQLFTTIDGTSSVMADYGCRAWVNFNGTGTVAIRGSGNVSSITDNNTGDYTINFTTAMPDANYAVAGSTVGSGSGATFVDSRGQAPTTTTCRFGTWSAVAGSTVDRDYVDVVIFR